VLWLLQVQMEDLLPALRVVCRLIFPLMFITLIEKALFHAELGANLLSLAINRGIL